MNKKEIREFAITHFPKIPWLRKKASQKIIASFRKYLLTPDEATACENHPAKKNGAVQKQKDKWPERYKKISEMAQHMLETAPRYAEVEDKNPIYTDMMFCYFAYGFLPDEYVFFNLEGKNETDRRSYMSDLDRLVFVFRVNDFAEKKVLTDKHNTYVALHEYFGRDAICIERPQDYDKFCEFTKEHPVFVRKLVDESKGNSVKLIDTKECSDLRAVFDELIGAGRTILEEQIIQAKKMAIFNSSSLNTVRIVTLKTKDGYVIPHAFFKNGRKGSFVDNGGAGGILIGIDPKTGVLTSDGFDEAGNVFPEHPESGVHYIGYQLPEWEKARELCFNAAKKIKGLQYIGWDAAYTDKGWLLVEGNKAGQMVGQQMTLQHGIKDELNELLKRVDVIC